MKPHPVVLVYFAERLSSRMRITATDALDETECGGGRQFTAEQYLITGLRTP